MKIKQTILALALVVGISGFFISPLASADTTCGGVKTSILDCEDYKGLCSGGENPYEGANPGNDTASETYKAYSANYGHNFGKCEGDVAPETDMSKSGIWGILLLAINILTAGIGVAAVGGIVYGSILYTSAGGDAAGVKKAKGIIVNVVIGIVAYVLMYSFLNYIIPGGLFT